MAMLLSLQQHLEQASIIHGKFVEADRCRMLQTCEYFGETPKAWTTCGECDVCQGLPAWLEKDEMAERRTVLMPSVAQHQLSALKVWRRDYARRKHVAPYVILHDRTLAELLLRQPGTVEELIRVPGIGVQKAKNYGDDILEALLAALEV